MTREKLLQFFVREKNMMKKSIMKVLAFSLCTSMMAGCAGETGALAAKNTEAGVELDEGGMRAASTGTDNDFAEALKEKYASQEKNASQEKYEYAEPLYNVPNDYNFVFENLTDAFMEQNEWDCFKVYYDSSLEGNGYVDIEMYKDYENNSLTIAPRLTFSYELDSGKLDDGTWGTRSKFYLVQYKDLETGEDLEKPIVTIFTMANDLNTPTISQGIALDGYYQLSWDAVEGADYYEVYFYDAHMDYSDLELVTEDTTCAYDEFKSAIEREQHWEEKYGDTEFADANHWTMNLHVQPDSYYFVVAKNDDGEHSGMSNLCYVNDVANQVPYTVSDDFQSEYEGSSALALPAYVEVQMIDGSIGNFLIDYHGATVMLLDDGMIVVCPTIKNLPISMHQIYLTGMDYDAFLEDAKNLTAREDELYRQAVTMDENIDIPYVPDNTEKPETEEPESETEDKKPEKPETEEPESETEDKKPEHTGTAPQGLTAELEDTVFAHTALGEWIAVHMLNHEEVIDLSGFSEAYDSEYLADVTLEAIRQNPLIGTVNELRYDYDTNSLKVSYYLTAEETEYMQTESLKKAAEIAGEVTDDSMSDYEKEKAINQYLCDNAAYNEDIYEYINEDGSISEEAAIKYVHSFTPYGVLCENFGVCESYAEAFLLIARAAGLEAVIETGTLENVGHEWNRVKIDGQWYTMDVTNNDMEILPNSYFNLSDELASLVLMQDMQSMMDAYVYDYTADDLRNEYYVKEGLYAENRDDAAALMIAGLNESKAPAIRLDQGSLSESDVDYIVEEAVNETQLASGRYYYYNGVLSIVKD